MTRFQSMSFSLTLLGLQVACSTPTNSSATNTSPSSQTAGGETATAGSAPEAANTHVSTPSSGGTPALPETGSILTTSTSSSGTSPGSASSLQLTGNWLQTACVSSGSNSSSKDTLTFTDTTYTNNRQFYSDTACQRAVAPAGGGTLTTTGTYSQVAATTLPALYNVHYAPTGTDYLALNITKISSDYGNAIIANSAASSYASQGCPGATVSGTVVNVTSCFSNTTASTSTYEYVLQGTGSISIGDAANVSGGCAATTGGALGPCTEAELMAQGQTYQKE